VYGAALSGVVVAGALVAGGAAEAAGLAVGDVLEHAVTTIAMTATSAARDHLGDRTIVPTPPLGAPNAA
jgi:hypothetical protein